MSEGAGPTPIPPAEQEMINQVADLIDNLIHLSVVNAHQDDPDGDAADRMAAMALMVSLMLVANRRGGQRGAKIARVISRSIDMRYGVMRHVATGGLYAPIGKGRIQTSVPLNDLDLVMLYRSLGDASLWARRLAEFEDGRFVPAPEAKL